MVSPPAWSASYTLPTVHHRAAPLGRKVTKIWSCKGIYGEKKVTIMLGLVGSVVIEEDRAPEYYEEAVVEQASALVI